MKWLTQAVCLLFLGTLLLGRPASSQEFGWTQRLRADVPTHAHEQRSGGGWACDPEFRRVKNTCVAAGLQAASYHTHEIFESGGWKCRRGYRLKGGFCVRLTVPRHALTGGVR